MTVTSNPAPPTPRHDGCVGSALSFVPSAELANTRGPRLRIAIASSGLGHTRRGVETWAEDLASAVREMGRNVTLYQGGGEPTEEWRVRLPCLQRFDRRTEKLQGAFRHFGGWRYGMGSNYAIEQTTFAFSLWRRIRRDFDILHVQDPWLALILDRLHRAGLSRPKVILGHGTEEDVSLLRKLSNLQHLTPKYDSDWQKHRPVGQFSIGIPNFIDTRKFRPGDKRATRDEWDLPQNFLIVLSVAALKKTHKRCDYVIREFAEFHKTCPNSILVLAGAPEVESDEVIALARTLGGGSVRVLPSVDRDRLLSLYQSADVFVLGSLWEMMPIAVIEALSCGVPVICHSTETLKWVVGEGGWPVNIECDHALVEALKVARNVVLRGDAGVAARQRAVCMFDKREIVSQVLQMYEAVNSHSHDLRSPQITRGADGDLIPLKFHR